MELGNMMFGNSRGAVPIERGEGYEEELDRLFEAYDPEHDGYGINDFENDVFTATRYYWGDCDCGFEERWEAKDEVWCEQNKHADFCYQTELRIRMAQYDLESGYSEIDFLLHGDKSAFETLFDTVEPVAMEGRVVGEVLSGGERKGELHERWRKAYKARDKFERALYTELCKKYDLPERGCAVHCTCEYDELRAKWCLTDDHDPKCSLIQPNFRHKKTGLEIQWYKYPLRDAYFNRECSLREFREIIDDCIDSLKQC